MFLKFTLIRNIHYITPITVAFNIRINMRILTEKKKPDFFLKNNTHKMYLSYTR